MTQTSAKHHQFTSPVALYMFGTPSGPVQVTTVSVGAPLRMRRPGELNPVYISGEARVTIDADIICLQAPVGGKFTMRVPDEAKTRRNNGAMFTAVAIGHNCVKLSYLGTPGTDELIVEYTGEVVSDSYQPPAGGAFPATSFGTWGTPIPRRIDPATYGNNGWSGSPDFETTGGNQWYPNIPPMPPLGSFWGGPAPAAVGFPQYNPFESLPQSVFLSDSDPYRTTVPGLRMIRMAKEMVNKPTLFYAVTATASVDTNTGMLEVVLRTVLPPSTGWVTNLNVNTQRVAFQYPQAQIKQLTMRADGDAVIVTGLFSSATSTDGVFVEEHRVVMEPNGTDLYTMDKVELINLVLELRGEKDKVKKD